jgi:transcriptional regulator with XRE-family HTH domain
MKKLPNPVDRHVGARVKSRRVHVGMSQEKLGDALGITFQQIQKYEKGANRIGASRLQLAAKVLGVPVNYFFEGAPADVGGLDGFSDGSSEPYVAQAADEAALLAAFARVADPQLRMRIIALVEAMTPPKTS